MSDRHRPKRMSLHHDRHTRDSKDQIKDTQHHGGKQTQVLMLISCQYITSGQYFPICVTAVDIQRKCTRESYSRDSVTVIGQTKIYAMNQQTKQFLITRIYMIAREIGSILLGSAACQWLGLIAMLCQNKAPIVGRLVASVTREETDGGEVEAYPIPKTGDSAEMTQSQHQSQRAITAAKEEEDMD